MDPSLRALFAPCARRRPGRAAKPCCRAYRVRARPRALRGGAVRAPDCARARAGRRAHVSRRFSGGLFSRRRETGTAAAPRGCRHPASPAAIVPWICRSQDRNANKIPVGGSGCSGGRGAVDAPVQEGGGAAAGRPGGGEPGRVGRRRGRGSVAAPRSPPRATPWTACPPRPAPPGCAHPAPPTPLRPGRSPLQACCRPRVAGAGCAQPCAVRPRPSAAAAQRACLTRLPTPG